MIPEPRQVRQVAAVGADPIFSAWERALDRPDVRFRRYPDGLPPGWPCEAGGADRYATDPEDLWQAPPVAVLLVSPWDASGPDTVRAARAALPPRSRVDVWLVFTSPSPRQRAELLAVGACGCLPRVPEPQAVRRFLRLAAWWPREAGGRVDGEYRMPAPADFGGSARRSRPDRSGRVRPRARWLRLLGAGPHGAAQVAAWSLSLPLRLLRAIGTSTSPKVPGQGREDASARSRVTVHRPARPPAAVRLWERACSLAPRSLGQHAPPPPWWAWPDGARRAPVDLVVLGVGGVPAGLPGACLRRWLEARGGRDAMVDASAGMARLRRAAPAGRTLGTRPVGAPVKGQPLVATSLGCLPSPVRGRPPDTVELAARAAAVALVADADWGTLAAARTLVSALRALGASDVRLWLAATPPALVPPRQLALALGAPCSTLGAPKAPGGCRPEDARLGPRDEGEGI